VCGCAVPPAPSNILVITRHSRSLMIGWQAPNPPHGVITQYVVKYRRHNMQYGVPFLVVLPPTSLTYNMTGLQPNVVYDVQVSTEFAFRWSSAVVAVTK